MRHYLLLRDLHEATVVASVLFFVVRAYWSITESPRLQRRWVKMVPHFIDSSILVLGIWLILALQLQIGLNTWLWAKWIGLVFYVGFGTFAIKRGKTPRARAGFTVLALLSVAYIFGAAYQKSVWSWAALL